MLLFLFRIKWMFQKQCCQFYFWAVSAVLTRRCYHQGWKSPSVKWRYRAIQRHWRL